MTMTMLIDGDAERAAEAARRLQRFVRSRASRRAFEAVTSKEAIEKLKRMFFDDRARKAGAESNPLYTTAVLSARNVLRTDVQVVEALEHAWKQVKTAFGCTADTNGLNFAQYSLSLIHI